jgi:predicted Zn-dependent peptidase
MHKAYYAPEEALLTIIGDVDPYLLKDALSDVTLPQEVLKKPVSLEGLEPLIVHKEADTITLDVLKPSVLIGLKVMLSHLDSHHRLIHTLKLSLIMDLLFGKSSTLYELWLDQKLINDSYGLESYIEKDYGYFLIGSESDNPEGLIEAINHALTHLETYALDQTMFNTAKKQMIGSFVMGLDNLEYLAHESNKHAHEGLDIYDTLAIASAITFEDLNHLNKNIARNQYTVLTVLPQKKA